MQGASSSVTYPRPRAATFALGDYWVLAAVLIAAAALVAFDPPGYFGGRWDDGRYLDAAIGWAEHGPQRGHDHWSLRWPVVLPVAAMIELFGRNRAAVMVPGLCAYFALITLNFVAARRAFGVAVAGVAVFALMSTDVVFGVATRITADLPEALFWTASVWAFVFAVRSDGDRQRNWLIAAGAAAGLAFATRETGGSLLIAAGIAFLAGVGPARARYLWIAGGFLAILLPEQILLWHASGDWLYRLHTDLRHIEIPSTNLAGLVAPHAFAPMNTDLMQRWLGAGPIHWWWVTDTWINLFLNKEYGFDFVVAYLGSVMLATGYRRVAPAGVGRTIGGLVALAAAHIVMVVYIVATDPKPRMFLPSIACACLILALAVATAWPRSRIIRIALILVTTVRLALMLFGNDVLASAHNPDAEVAERAAARVSGPLSVNRWTMSRLELADPALRARLSTTKPPVGGLWLTSGNVVDDARGDTAPPAGARWRRVVRLVSTRRPWSFAVLGIPPDPPATVAADPSYHPTVTIYRRVG